VPLEGLICWCDSCKGEQTLAIDEALDHAQRRRGGPFPYELLKAMLAQNQERGERISTTTLTTKCLRSEVLQRLTAYTHDPKRMYASFRGTMFHGQLELHASPTAIAEPRYHVIDLFGMGPFSGSPDLVDVDTGNLYDYKFSKENPRWDTPWKDHIVQGQVNRWLCDHCDYVEWQGTYYPMNVAGVAHAPTDKQVSTLSVEANRKHFIPVDWQGVWVVYMDDKGPKPILCTKSVQVP
jgi:hypothetical protein